MENHRASCEGDERERLNHANAAKRVMLSATGPERRRFLRNILVKVETLEANALTPIPTLQQLGHDDEKETVDNLILLLVWAGGQLNVTEPLSDEQYESCALTLLVKYKMLRLEDIAIALRQGVTGEYGRVTNRVDVSVICGWVNAYRALLSGVRSMADKNLYQQNLLNSSGAGDPALGKLANKLKA